MFSDKSFTKFQLSSRLPNTDSLRVLDWVGTDLVLLYLVVMSNIWINLLFSVKSVEQNTPQSTISTPSTISPAPDSNPDEEYSKSSNLSHDYDKVDASRNKDCMR